MLFDNKGVTVKAVSAPHGLHLVGVTFGGSTSAVMAHAKGNICKGKPYFLEVEIDESFIDLSECMRRMEGLDRNVRISISRSGLGALVGKQLAYDRPNVKEFKANSNYDKSSFADFYSCALHRIMGDSSPRLKGCILRTLLEVNRAGQWRLVECHRHLSIALVVACSEFYSELDEAAKGHISFEW